MKKLWNPEWVYVNHARDEEEPIFEPTPPSSHIAEFGGAKYILRQKAKLVGYERQGSNYKLPYQG